MVFLLAGPLVTVFFIEGEKEEILIALGVVYLGFSPLTVLLGRLLVKNFRAGIIVTGESVSIFRGAYISFITWAGLVSFVFDYIQTGESRYGVARYFVLYRVRGGDSEIRFNRLMTPDEMKREEDISVVSSFRKKSYRFDAYGLYFNKKTCDRLVNDIINYCGSEPVREKGFF